MGSQFLQVGHSKGDNSCRELGEVLMSCGGFAMKEWVHHFSSRFGQKTAVKNVNDTNPFLFTNFYHPFAFIGIPGLAPGKAFE